MRSCVCDEWIRGRVAEGAPLLREYGVNSSIEGSNPSVSAIFFLKLYYNENRQRRPYY